MKSTELSKSWNICIIVLIWFDASVMPPARSQPGSGLLWPQGEARYLKKDIHWQPAVVKMQRTSAAPHPAGLSYLIYDCTWICCGIHPHLSRTWHLYNNPPHTHTRQRQYQCLEISSGASIWQILLWNQFLRGPVRCAFSVVLGQMFATSVHW